jgi:hypothetical protein
MLSEGCCCSLSEKSLSRCCWHRCSLLTVQVLVQVQVQVQVQVRAQVLVLLPGPKLWHLSSEKLPTRL